MCGGGGEALVLAPPVEAVYAGRQLITVAPGPMGDVLESTARPGHFAGILTVVLK